MSHFKHLLKYCAKVTIHPSFLFMLVGKWEMEQCSIELYKTWKYSIRQRVRTEFLNLK